LMGTKLAPARGDSSCSERATISLPVPLSPVMRTVELDAATTGSKLRIALIASLSPTKFGTLRAFCVVKMFLGEHGDSQRRRTLRASFPTKLHDSSHCRQVDTFSRDDNFDKVSTPVAGLHNALTPFFPLHTSPRSRI